MEKLIAKAMEMTIEQILEAVMFIGGGQVTTDFRMVRAALIEAYSRKTSGEDADALMDLLGM